MYIIYILRNAVSRKRCVHLFMNTYLYLYSGVSREYNIRVYNCKCASLLDCSQFSRHFVITLIILYIKETSQKNEVAMKGSRERGNIGTRKHIQRQAKHKTTHTTKTIGNTGIIVNVCILLIFAITTCIKIEQFIAARSDPSDTTFLLL